LAFLGSEGVVLWAPDTAPEASVLELSLLEGQKAAVLRTLAGQEHIEVLGDDKAAVRSLLRCRRGPLTLPFDDCAKSFEGIRLGPAIAPQAAPNWQPGSG
jgi:hypothetical protein